jgi:glycosyltransferase 2 family protein
MIENLPERSTRSYLKYIINLFGTLVIVLLIVYLYNNRDVLGFLKNIRWQHILWIVVLDTFSFLIGALLNKSLINRFDSKVGLLDCVFLQYGNNFLNKILPTIGGGAAFRAIYLKRKYQFPYSQFISTVGGLYVISFLSVATVGIACLLAIYIRYSQFNVVIFLAFIALLLPCLFVILFSPQIPASNNKILKALKSIVDGWKIIKQDPKFILVYALLSIALLLLSAMQTLISYQALGVQTTFIPMLFLGTLGIVLAFLNFTPDGIGIKEGIYIFSADLVQIPDNILVLGSLVLRSISFSTTLVIGGISYWIIMRDLKKLEFQTSGKKLD